jgi:bifunctional non-homologous end joining protein LigD
VIWREKPGGARPMLATLADPPLSGSSLVFEPKYDGIRAVVEIEPAPARTRARAGVRVWSRLGNDKTSQFPSIVAALASCGAREPLVVDGEIVALDTKGQPVGFQRLQGRIHLSDAKDVERIDREQPVAFIAFDLLREGNEDLRGLALVERRARLERLFGGVKTGTIRLSEQVAGDGRALHARAQKEGWEGLIVKEARSPYQSGRRSPTWRKLKLHHEQEFVVGGYTEPRNTRQYFGALLLGVYENRQSAVGGRRSGVDSRKLVYVGHTGTGFDERELERVSKLLKARETKHSPFAEPIKSNETAHWVRPDLVAQVRFTEWTDDNKLRHPVYLGLRDDKPAESVVREKPAASPNLGPARRNSEPLKVELAARAPAARARRGVAERAALGGGAPRALRSACGPSAARSRRARASGGGAPRALRNADGVGGSKSANRAKSKGAERASADRATRRSSHTVDAETAMSRMQPVVDQLRALEDSRRDGTIVLPDGGRLGVTNLAKPFWPKLELTKGDLLRYYATVAPLILPVVADRPLVMKRFPNGVDDRIAFYQQRRQKEQPPPGVRIETLPDELDPIDEQGAERFIGGSLITLLYMTQLAAISQDPWFSRVQSPLDADFVALDLDPGEGATLAQVLDVARWVRDELASMRVPAVPKTSGSRGLHIYIPLPPGTSYESGQLFCQIVATVIAARHPKVATVERMVKKRRRGTVYVDFLQNILGKTLACAYSARASDFAGVSTPLTWEEVEDGVDPRDFTIVTAPARFREIGDLWARLRTSKTATLETVFGKYGV